MDQRDCHNNRRTIACVRVDDGAWHHERPGRRVAGRGRGFTIVEILVVVVTIAVLLGIILVALTRASAAARRNASEAKLNTIGQAIAAFEQEMGYAPPLLTPEDPNWEFGEDDYPTGANSFTVPQLRFYDELGLQGNAALEAMARTRYMSEFSLTVYLMGIGDLYQSNDPDNGLSSVFDDGVEGPGFVNPGRDRSWGGARDRGSHDARSGPVIGPYLDPGQFSGSLELVEFDGGGIGGADVRGMYRLLDDFDYPIRYYEGLLTKVNANMPGVTDASGSAFGRPTGRFLPPELRGLESWEAWLADPDGPAVGGFDLGAVDNDLTGAKWALLAAGRRGEDVDPDADPTITADRPARLFIAPFGDSAVVNGQREMFRLEPLATTQSQFDLFERELDVLRRGIESNVKVIGR